MSNKREMCAQCTCWEPGDFWGTSQGTHGVLIESKGWCMFKKDKNGDVVKRKRWNYCHACENFDKKQMSGFIYQGGGGNTIEEDLTNLGELMKELAEDNG